MTLELRSAVQPCALSIPARSSEGHYSKADANSRKECERDMLDHYEWLVWAACFLSLIVGGYIIQRKSAKKKRARFATRRSLIPDEFYKEFYSHTEIPPEVVSTLMREIGEVLHIEPGKLRPADRFGRELAEVDDALATDCSLSELEWYAQMKAKSLGTTIDLSAVETLDELLKLLARAVGERGNARR